VRTRYQEPPQKKLVVDSNLAQCTFAPQINEVKRDMGSAQLYLEEDAFERLNRTGNLKSQNNSTEIHQVRQTG